MLILFKEWGEIKYACICLLLQEKYSRHNPNNLYLQGTGRAAKLEEEGRRWHLSEYNFLYSLGFWKFVNVLNIQN